MSPTNTQDGETRRAINGPRPLPLRINKHSSVIHKLQPNPTAILGHVPAHDQSRQQNLNAQKRQPVIIYTHSPKIIHAQAQDFMALVQKLTGLSRSDRDDEAEGESKKNDTKSSSSLGETISMEETEKFGSVIKRSSSSVSPMYKENNTYLADAPLFTPNSGDFYFSSRHRQLQSPSMGNSISPTFLELLKGFPEY